uniref:Tc1-like transposase DDE domain-containing protein n=1 Tax=Poecilia latipinna TaxID=48699 RepID=A0A3B3UT88_9TELE
QPLPPHLIIKIITPALSPGLNPVKTLWDQLSRQAAPRNSVPHNLNDLKAALLEEWDAKPLQTISLLVNSRRRLCACVIWEVIIFKVFLGSLYNFL